MSYLITELSFYLLVTAVLAIVVGWLAKGLRVARRERLQEEAWRGELRRSEARAGNLKNQLAEAFLVEERLRNELSRFQDGASEASSEKLETVRAELARRDKMIELLRLQITQSEAALSSEWQSLKAVKSEIAERQQRFELRGKEVSGKLKSSEETRQQLRLQLRSLKKHSDHLQQELAATKLARDGERRNAAARIAALEAKLKDLETIVALHGKIDEVAEKPAAKKPVEPADDDLKRVRGIGPVLHRKLNKIGVTSFRQIASWSDDDVTRVARRIGIGAGRIRKSGWVEAAGKLQGEA